MHFLQSALLLVTAWVSLAHALSSPPSGALVVSKSPSSGQYKSVQAAVNALSKSSSSKQTIFIEAGTYSEQVLVPSLSGPLAIYGSTSDSGSYKSNTVTITHAAGQSDGLNNDQTGTLRVMTSKFSLYNVNVVNSKGQGTQAIALSAQAGQQGYYGVSLKGYQDTLLAQTGAQVYAKSYIEGAVDFVFGQHGQVWIHDCDIGVSAGGGYVIASGRNSSSENSWYVIDSSRIQAASGKSVSSGSTYLGRPWGLYARAVVQKSTLSSIINSAGWSMWNKGDERTANAYLAEYSNTGAGASGQRASFSRKLSSAVDITTVLGSSYESWADKSYL
ncbi:carbohydrate esterase family 8 protein [Acaromyces ingoldii]|uniref:Pectinesterase n=1 Tax=Acaromyces ingoldii TaxID=215250 RepID=A0A316YCP1_9BASI|nr:carbohydrate esterase family 8 protein [Acaromyces ingoldii]PWN87237.1 carbohydrate esterase family 8 protein [Acaromyces ingoldii]